MYYTMNQKAVMREDGMSPIVLQFKKTSIYLDIYGSLSDCVQYVQDAQYSAKSNQNETKKWTFLPNSAYQLSPWK